MLRISVTRPLPPRPRRMIHEELQRVFGGYVATCDGNCATYCDCCDGYACTNQKCVFTPPAG